MALAYLASASDHWPIPPGWPRAIIFFTLLALIFVALFVFRFRRIRRLKRGPDFEGPALTGTARISSVDFSSLRSYATKAVCRIGLRVKVPDYQPYDVVVRTVVPIRAAAFVGDWDGGIVAVQVDSANPQRVRIDFNEPPPGQPYGPPHDYVDFGKYQRDFKRQYIVAWTAAVMIVVILYIFFSTR